MATLTIRIPDVHAQKVADATSATYGVKATGAGVREHLIQHLRETVREYRRRLARRQADDDLVFDPTWDDLEEEEEV